MNFERNELNLYFFNSFCGLISCILTIMFFIKVYKGRLSSRIIIIFSTIIYLFQTEVIHSQGIAYWHQSIYQVLILLQLNCFLSQKESCMKKIGFFILCIIIPYVEWFGYISNMGFAIVSLLDNSKMFIVLDTPFVQFSSVKFIVVKLSPNLGAYILFVL